jgi:hypothetical protein
MPLSLSYSQDGDGYVSQDDYKLAKRFDFDGNGVIDPYERNIAKHVIADEFFKAHKDHIHVFGPEIASSTHEENVSRLEKAPNFERNLSLLKEIENSLRGRSSKEMIACMGAGNTTTATGTTTGNNNIATATMFYSNKLDTTAWNTSEGVPLSERSLSTLTHHGSRNKLLESRKYSQRSECRTKLDAVYEKEPKYNTQRLALITNPDLW